MQKMIEEYQKTIRQLTKIREGMDEEQKKVESKIIGGMISDLQYAVDWMKTGRRPGNRRGVERLAAYQRERVMDPLVMQSYVSSAQGDPFQMIDDEPVHSITKDEKERLEDALSVLTKKEREVYLMSRGFCLSYAEIANYLCVSRSAVQDAVERAEKKIAKRTMESLFCLCG